MQAGIEATVGERRARGDYPAGLEDELDAHWRRVSAGAAADGPVAAALDAAQRAGRFRVPDVPATSRAPGGAVVHRVVGRTVSRHLGELVGQLDAYAGAVHACLAALAQRLADPGAHDHAELTARLDEVAEQLAGLHRTTNRLLDAAGPGPAPE